MPLLESFDDALAAPSQVASSSSSNGPKRSLVGGVLFHDTLTATKVNWDELTQRNLVSHSHGLVSSVYRRPLSPSASWPYERTSSSSASTSALARAVESADGLPGWVCIKRVAVDEQPRPHSIAREVALLDLLPSHRHITPLLAAVYDTSDPFGAVVDLVMPLYAATLEEVLQEPSLLASPAEECSIAETKRPGASIQHLWSHSPPTFIHSIATQLLDGIAFLHEHKIAHRDIKPSNILLSHTGTVKLIDLGTAYTTTTLRNPLPDDDTSLDDEAEQMVCQVGTGEYRAPELLFSPLGGYDAFAVDVWAVAVTLAHFFMPLTAIPTRQTSELPSLDVEQDERKDWQRAFDSNTPLPASSSDAGDSPLYFNQDPYPEDDPAPGARSESGYLRTPLFEAQRGDIGLAASIFALLGLPTSIQVWPEAAHFQPRLERMPFAASAGKGALTALPLFQPEQGGELEEVVHSVILPALQLSASKRPTARQLLNALSAR